MLGKNQLTFFRNICGKKQQIPLCQFDELPGIICTLIETRRWNYETLNWIVLVVFPCAYRQIILFIYYHFLLTNKQNKITSFNPITVSKLNFVIQEDEFFRHFLQTGIRPSTNLRKSWPLIYWTFEKKNRSYGFFEFKTVINTVACIVHTASDNIYFRAKEKINAIIIQIII